MPNNTGINKKSAKEPEYSLEYCISRLGIISLDECKERIEQGEDPNLKDQSGRTTLMRLCSMESKKLKYGALKKYLSSNNEDDKFCNSIRKFMTFSKEIDVNIENSKGYSAIFYAIVKGRSYNAFKILVEEYGALIPQGQKLQNKLLLSAISIEKYHLICYLIEDHGLELSETAVIKLKKLTDEMQNHANIQTPYSVNGRANEEDLNEKTQLLRAHLLKAEIKYGIFGQTFDAIKENSDSDLSNAIFSKMLTESINQENLPVLEFLLSKKIRPSHADSEKIKKMINHAKENQINP